MTISNSEEYVASLWDWQVLDGCFGGGNIKPSDIDGMVERNGHFLYLETKGINVALKLGQKIAIENRVKDGISTCVVIWGNPGAPEHMQVFRPVFYASDEAPHACNLQDLRNFCQRWYNHADTTDARQSMMRALGVQ